MFSKFIMVRIGVWNIRGLNSSSKQKEVEWCIRNNNVAIFAILETKVSCNNRESIGRRVFKEWGIQYLENS